MKKFIFLGVAVVLIASIYCLWVNSTEEVSRELLLLGKSGSIGLSGEMIKELDAQPEDTEKIAFQSIKKRLEDFRLLNPDITFIYLYTQRDGDLFFMADAEPAGSSNYSPPGQIYDEADPQYYLPFQNKESFITSVVKDRWGSWITILTPILDESGEVMAVLGMDIDSEQWQWEIASRMILPFSFIVLVIIGLTSFLIAVRPSSQSPRPILKRLLPALFVIISLMVLVPGFLFLNWEMNNLRETSEGAINNSIQDIKVILKGQQAGLSLAVHSIANDKETINLLRKKDSEALLSSWQNTFQKMNESGDLTHFYFFDEKRVCFLRVHNPSKSGDLINRYTALQAEETRKTSGGLEMGPLGTFTMRVVEPVIVNGRIIGYIELGKEIEEVLALSAANHNNEIIVNLSKEFLNKDNWESGMKMLGRESDWNRFSDKATIYNSIDLPDDVWNELEDGNYSFNNRRWMIRTFPALDVSGQEVGEIVVARDITPCYQMFMRMIIIGAAIIVLFMIMLFSVVYNLLWRTDKSINLQKKKLEDSIQRFNELAEKSRTFIWEVDTKANYTYVSSTLEKIAGYKPEELVGKKDVFDIHPSKGRKQFKDSVLRTMKNREEFIGLENPIQSKDGRIIWVLSAGVPVFGPQGEFVGYRGSDIDITDLKESRDQNEALIKNVPGVVYRCSNDKNWTMSFISAYIEQLTGYAVADFIDNKKISFADAIYPDDRDYVERVINQAVKKEESWQAEYRMVRSDKKIVWVYEKGSLVGDMLDGIIIDITDRKKAEDELRLASIAIANEKEKIQAIVEGIGDGVFVVDCEQKITLFNPQAEKISGFKSEEVLGRKFSDVLKFISEDDGSIKDSFIIKTLTTGQRQEMANHTALIRKDGSMVSVADSSAPIKEEEKVVGCVVVFRDVTQERLIDKAKTEFVSLASHQLRTPLSAINWYTEMILAGDAGRVTKEQKKYLEEIYAGNKRMVELVNALLNVSRLELGTFSVEPQPTNLINLSKDVVKEMMVDTKEKRQTVTEKYDDLPEILVDPKLTRMVFQNLISNAVKYTPEDGKIEVELSKVKANQKIDGVKVEKNSILVRVQDSGFGIPVHQHDKIFKKLFRADNIVSRDTEGTGLGLYIVKSIVDHSDGKIWFRSQEDQGTTFYVLLPLTGMKKKKGSKQIE